MIRLKELPMQERNEETKLFARRHWIVIFWLFCQAIVLFGIPTASFLYFSSLNHSILQHPFWQPTFIVLLLTYTIAIWAVLISEFTDYYLDTWIITTERIINIEQEGLFARTVATLHLNQIQDVTSETHGPLATILSYGNVYIQTAGTRERFNFKQIDDPEAVKQLILELSRQDKIRHGDASQMMTTM